MKTITTITILLLLVALTAQSIWAQIDSTSLKFDGTDDYVTIPDDSAYYFGTDDFTFEAWINADLIQGNYPLILSKRLAGNAFSGFIFGLATDGKLYAQLDGSNFIPGLGPDLRDNTCHHVALSRINAASDTLRFFLDGQVLGYILTGDTDIDTDHPIWIGWDEPNPGNHYYNGFIKEVRVWNVARTEQEIQDNMNIGLTGNEAGLVGYWQLRESSGQVVTDYSANANHGYLGNSSGIDSSDPLWDNSCGIAITGLDHIDKLQSEVPAYPNPTTGLLTVDMSALNIDEASMGIYNIYGKELQKAVKSLSNGKFEFDLSTYAEGVYFVRCVTDKRVINKRIILIR